MNRFFCALGSLLILTVEIQASETQANEMTELSFTAAQDHPDPFNTVTIDVVFRDPQGRTLRVPTFWAGGKVWKVRYASPVIGAHQYRSECPGAADKGLDGVTGVVEIRPYMGTNPLYLHGPIRVSENRRYFEHQDGTPFFWLGDTWWMGLSARLHFPDEFQRLAADRKEKGFTVIQLVAGLYPDMFPFDPRGVNEAGHPWETNYSRIRPEYFDAADRRLEYLVQQGMTPCVVGAWGYFMPWMGVEKLKAHWRYLIARYGALPVVWCAAGEANLPWYLEKGFPYDDRKQVAAWTEVMRYIRATDPYHRPLTVHPTGIGRLSARNATDDSTLLDFDFLQTPHGQRDAVAPTVKTVRESYADKPVMPVIDGEAAYEMLSDSLPTEWTRQMFWLCLMNGAAGHTYGANGIWQCNRPGDPHGKSPHGGSYGKIPWDEAMRLPGSAQEGFGKKLLMEYAWQKFEPHPEWATFAADSLVKLEGASWIWYPEGEPAKDAPVGKCFFRREFVLPAHPVREAALRALADDKFEARINGENLGGDNDWRVGKQFSGLARLLKPGTNLLEITAENLPAKTLNPAGLLAALEIQFVDVPPMALVSDAQWECSRTRESWTNALVAAPFAGGPWGRVADSQDAVYGPQSAGIPGVVRIMYSPQPRALLARRLKSSTRYSAAYFDPVTGIKTTLGAWTSGDTDHRKFPPPPGCDHDWVLILEDQ